MIIGLGNPEARFNDTPHNVGFVAIDMLKEALGAQKTKERQNGEIALVEVNGEEILLVKPLTYMNSSGECVRKLIRKHKIRIFDIIVLVDDISVKAGEVKMKLIGSVGSHNGMKSIAACIGTTDFVRLRIGVGEPKQGQDLADYVLGKIPSEIFNAVSQGIAKAAQMVIALITERNKSA